MRFQTKQGSINFPASVSYVEVPFSRAASLLHPFTPRQIPFTEIRSVAVGGNDKKYLTGKRAAGVVLTGGLGLLAPSRVRGTVVIGLTSGEVLEFTLKGRDAKRPDTIAMYFSNSGVEVV